VSKKFIPEIAKNWEDVETNPEYWWNIKDWTCEMCHLHKRLSYSNKCWECLNKEEKKDYKKLTLKKYEKVENLKGLNMYSIDLKEIDLRGVNLRGADLGGANLKGANLSYAYLEGASFTVAHLEGAGLNRAHLEDASFWQANLEGAHLVGAHLEGAIMMDAHLEGAYLIYANFEGAYLTDAHLEGTDLSYANLDGVDLSNAKFGRMGMIMEKTQILKDKSFVKENQFIEEAKIKYAKTTNIKGITYNTYTRFYIYPFAILFWFFGYIFNKIIRKEYTVRPKFSRYKKTILIGIDTTELDWSQHPQLIRDIHYQQFLYAFRERSFFNKYVLYPLWGLTSYFGERFTLWFMWLILLIAGFGAVYAGYSPPFFLPERIRDFFCNIYPVITSNGVGFGHWFDPYYLSGLVFTSLGLGSFQPENLAGKIWILAEVLLGFIMLGSLVSFFANKFVRRD
jgi:hypothetical protein